MISELKRRFLHNSIDLQLCLACQMLVLFKKWCRIAACTVINPAAIVLAPTIPGRPAATPTSAVRLTIVKQVIHSSNTKGSTQFFQQVDHAHYRNA